MWKDWYVAVVDADVAFDPDAHRRLDLDVIAVRINESEEAGQAVVSLTLAGDISVSDIPGQWMWLSRELADGSLLPMAYGRLVSIPTRGMGDEPVLQYHCSPEDWDGPQNAACAAKAILPAFDPVLVAKEKRVDPKEILDGWCSVVHCHRVSHAFTTPDKFGTGLPTYTFDDPYGPPTDSGPRTKPIEKYVSAVNVTLTCEFTQALDGIIDLTQDLKDAFPRGIVDTLTPDALERSWFKAGSKIGGESGYTFVDSTLKRLSAKEVAAFNVANPLPEKAGPFHAAPEKSKTAEYYNFVTDETLTSVGEDVLEDGDVVERYDYIEGTSGDPAEIESAELNFDIAYYNTALSVWWTQRQKRRETITFTLANGAQSIAPGEIRDLNLRCEDVTDDSSTRPWMPGEDYVVGDKRRVGVQIVECLVAHTSAATWLDDQTEDLPNGTTQDLWQTVPEDSSPLQSPSLASYLLTNRGEQTFQAAILKARRILAESIRGEVTFRDELADAWLGLTTACNARLVAPGYIDGDECAAKVYSYEIYSGQDDEYIEITTRPMCGSGGDFEPSDPLPPVYGWIDLTVNGWDKIAYSSLAGFDVIVLAAPGLLIGQTNCAAEQETYIKAHDFIKDDPERGGDKDNDPNNIVKQIPTDVVIQFSQIGGIPSLDASFDVSGLNAWKGPRQYDAGL